MTPRRCAARCRTQRRSRSSRDGRRRSATSAIATGRWVGPDLRRHPALPAGAGLPLRGRAIPLTDLDVRERRPVVVLGWEVASKLFDVPARAVGQEGPDRGARTDREGRHRAEGARAGPVVRRLRADAHHDLRVDVRPPQDDRRLGEDARCRRDRRGHAARRGGDARGAPAAAGGGERLHASTRPTRWWPSGRR